MELGSRIRRAGAAGSALALGSLLLLVQPAAAQDDIPAAPPGNDATLRDTPAVDAAMPQALPPARGSTVGDLGEHQMTGVIRAIDPNGTLEVDVGGKELRVIFPVSATSKLATGDRVTVTVAVQKLAPSQP